MRPVPLTNSSSWPKCRSENRFRRRPVQRNEICKQRAKIWILIAGILAYLLRDNLAWGIKKRWKICLLVSACTRRGHSRVRGGPIKCHILSSLRDDGPLVWLRWGGAWQNKVIKVRSVGCFCGSVSFWQENLARLTRSVGMVRLVNWTDMLKACPNNSCLENHFTQL